MRDAAFESLAVGFFDGVHRGHREILRGASAVLTFRNHPLSLLTPASAPRLIMTPEQRIAAIEACGVKTVHMLDFTREVANVPAADFAVFLERQTGLRFPVLRCGFNWRFGKDGAGDADVLRRQGFTVEVVPAVEYKGGCISSSRIRACVERGEIEDTNAMMGRRLEVKGQRSAGKGLGRQLGYPTINLTLQPPAVNPRPTTLDLPLGVYEVELNGQKGVANYGLSPTMGDRSWKAPVLEVHLLAPRPLTSDDLGRQASVQFVRFLRPERKFTSLEELRRQIVRDCAAVTGVLR